MSRKLTVGAALFALACVTASGAALRGADQWSQVPVADGFDFPVGWPDAIGYYDAQPFGDNQHLGEDWNGNGGGDSDFGDPIHAIAVGQVIYARHAGPGWGNVARVVHRYQGAEGVRVVESFYAHLASIDVRVGDLVDRGEVLGAMGNADGLYYAHLHFELRTDPNLGLGPGYSVHRRGWTSPSAFIAARRPPDSDGMAGAHP